MITARFRDSLQLAAPGGGGPVWIHIAPLEGEFPGVVTVPAGYEVPGLGKVPEPTEVPATTVFNRSTREAILQSFDAETPVLVDYEHFSHDRDKATEAAAWGREVRASADGIEMETAWTPPAREKIAGAVYRFISPEFDGELRQEDGVLKFYPSRLTGAGLTNRPKLKTLRPVSTNRNTEETNTMNDALKLLCGLIGCAETATPEELAQATDAFKQRVSGLEAENAKLRDDRVSADMKANEDVIGKCRDEAKALLCANRDAALALFASQREALAAAKPAAQDKPPVHQKNRATAPDGLKLLEREEGADEAASARFRAVEAKAQSIATERGIPFGQAFELAKAEIPA